MDNKAIVLTLGIGAVLAWPHIEEQISKANQANLEQKVGNSSELFAAGKKAEKKVNYTILNDSNYKKEVLNYKKPCIVLFYDSNKTRSPPSYRMKKVLDALVKEYNGKIKFCEYDGNKINKKMTPKASGEKMKNKYGVEGYPTTIIYKNGKKIDDVKGGPSTVKKIDFYINVIKKNIENNWYVAFAKK